MFCGCVLTGRESQPRAGIGLNGRWRNKPEGGARIISPVFLIPNKEPLKYLIPKRLFIQGTSYASFWMCLCHCLNYGYILVSWYMKELPLSEISNARPIVNTTPSPSHSPPATVWNVQHIQCFKCLVTSCCAVFSIFRRWSLDDTVGHWGGGDGHLKVVPNPSPSYPSLLLF